MNYSESMRYLTDLNQCTDYASFQTKLNLIIKNNKPLLRAPMFFSNSEDSGKIVKAVNKIITNKKDFIKSKLDKKRISKLKKLAKPLKPIVSVKRIACLATIIFVSFSAGAIAMRAVQNDSYNIEHSLMQKKIDTAETAHANGLLKLNTCSTDLKETKKNMDSAKDELFVCTKTVKEIKSDMLVFKTDSEKLKSCKSKRIKMKTKLALTSLNNFFTTPDVSNKYQKETALKSNTNKLKTKNLELTNKLNSKSSKTEQIVNKNKSPVKKSINNYDNTYYPIDLANCTDLTERYAKFQNVLKVSKALSATSCWRMMGKNILDIEKNSGNSFASQQEKDLFFLEQEEDLIKTANEKIVNSQSYEQNQSCKDLGEWFKRYHHALNVCASGGYESAWFIMDREGLYPDTCQK